VGSEWHVGNSMSVTIGAAFSAPLNFFVLSIFEHETTLPFISLEATSGYSTSMDLSWLAARDWMDLCGNDNYPPYSGIIYIS
jgi:hypothetical protein